MRGLVLEDECGRYKKYSSFPAVQFLELSVCEAFYL